jgi:hypothetical protein
MGPEAAAVEVVAAVAEPAVDEAVELPVEPPVDVADDPEVVDAPGPTALAFNLPQTKEWQKAWPLALLGVALTHWPTQESHSRDGKVWP